MNLLGRRMQLRTLSRRISMTYMQRVSRLKSGSTFGFLIMRFRRGNRESFTGHGKAPFGSLLGLTALFTRYSQSLLRLLLNVFILIGSRPVRVRLMTQLFLEIPRLHVHLFPLPPMFLVRVMMHGLMMQLLHNQLSQLLRLFKLCHLLLQLLLHLHFLLLLLPEPICNVLASFHIICQITLFLLHLIANLCYTVLS